MTGTTVTTKVYSGVSNLVGNLPLEQAMQAEFDKLGPVPFEKEDEAFAEEIRKTLTTEDIAASFQRAGRQTPPELPLCDFVAPWTDPAMEAKAQQMLVMLVGLRQQYRRGLPLVQWAHHFTHGKRLRKAKPLRHIKAWFMQPKLWRQQPHI